MSYLCLKRDIPEGGWKCFSSNNFHLILKKENNKITVAENRCSHRGFKVAEGNGQGRIKCPYHGIAFEFQEVIPHTEHGEFIFLGEENHKVLFPILGDQFDEVNTVIRANPSLWFMNTMDPNHLKTVHDDTFSDLFESHKPREVVISGKASSYFMDVKPSVKHKYSKYITSDFYFDNGFYHMSVFPNLSVTSFLGIFFSVETSFINEYHSVIQTRFFKAPNSPVPQLLLNLAMENNKKILREDMEIVNRWEETYDLNRKPRWLDGEQRIKHYEDLMRKYIL